MQINRGSFSGFIQNRKVVVNRGKRADESKFLVEHADAEGWLLAS